MNVRRIDSVALATVHNSDEELGNYSGEMVVATNRDTGGEVKGFSWRLIHYCS